MDLGDFTAAVSEAEGGEPDTFTFYGETFDVAPAVSAIPSMMLAAAAEEDEMGQLRAIYRFLEQSLAPDTPAVDPVYDPSGKMLEPAHPAVRQFGRFLDTCLKHRVPDDVVFGVAQKVMEVIAGRPTRQPTVSSVGPVSTSPSSKPDSSSPVSQAMLNAGLGPEEMVDPEQAVVLLRAV